MTRVFVDPLKVTGFGETRGHLGATMEDGTVYKAKRGGVMDVEDAGHIAAMKRDGRVAVEGFAPKTSRAGRICTASGCTWRGWAWQTVCSSCGSPLEDEVS